MQIAEDNKSVLVSSGTGSGKTECFMVPVLEDLIRQHALKKGPMSGVQAIFLYPLNALINSQQERLRSWTKGFNGDIRFALYNGETRQNSFDVKEEQNLHPEQILSRENLRDTPPSVLVTNATMLEYMLVRKADEPIISKSKGMLKYIVLDEAHSYIGSQAAELSLLLRRVMEAYGVGPGTDNPVQLIATSATIGEDTPEGNAQLESFISALAGTTADRVEVIRGYRDVPALSVQTKINDRSPREQLSFLQSLSSEALYEELSHFRLTRALRQAFNNSAKAAISLSELVNIAQQYDPNVDSESLLDILDLMTFAQPNEPNIDAFVPLRIHSFLRTIAGLWACANPDCSQQHPKLQQPTWPFGQVYFDVQHACSCGSPVFELLNCSGCGTPYLAAEEKIEEGQSWLKSRRLDLDDDEFLLDAEGGADTDDIAVNSGSFDRLLGLGGDLTTVSAEATTTGLIVQSDGVTFSVPMLRPEQKKEVGGGVKRSFRCSCCGDLEFRPGQLFRHARLGAPFFLGDMIPTLLEYSPLPESATERRGPFKGRRLLTFTDSRQGTARISARLQQDADRNTVRSVIYHELARDVGAATDLTSEDISLLQESASQLKCNPMMGKAAVVLEDSIKLITSGHGINQDARGILNNMKMMLQMSGPQYSIALDNLLAADCSAPAAIHSWEVLSQQLAESHDVGDRMRDHMNKESEMRLDKRQFADFCLYREFGRRPKNGWSIESLGLVAIRYPHLETICITPPQWKQLVTDPQQQLPEWRNFLKIILDFYIRGNSAVWHENDNYQRWMGSKVPRQTIRGPGIEKKEHNLDLLWPQIRQRHYNRIIKLLLVAFPQIQPEDEFWKANVNDLMSSAWTAVRPMLRVFDPGFQLDIKAKTEFYTPQKVWYCPYTRKALDVTLLGYSPYLPKQHLNQVMLAELIEMPELPIKHWRNPDDSPVPKEQRTNWLENDPTVVSTRKLGLWPNRSDRIAIKDPWYRLEEHSAQQRPETNKMHEELFKEGRVNVLNCSTTMEMGVDIGGMSVVAMNNVPPSPSNYLQRAGRAGRRAETAAAAVTLCKNTAHGMEVFANPLWPFSVSAQPPQVRLDSESIVQRHVNAFALGNYLSEHTNDATKLTCVWFFESTSTVSHCERFRLWLKDKAQSADDRWSHGVIRIVKGTQLAHLSKQALISRVVYAIETAEQQWLGQLEVILKNLNLLKDDNPNWEETPAGKSVMYQLHNYRGAYLFSKLASESFLPGYGFPVGVVTFNYETMDELERKKAIKEQKKQEGKESFSRFFEKLPSRDLPTALREYAPGADVVLGGKVYRSSGVMLGKVLSSGVELKEDSQYLPWFWHCRVCGSGETVPTYPNHCSHCGAAKSKLDIRRYLQPLGFASDIRYHTHNDVSQPSYAAYKHPRVLLPNAEWIPMLDASLGRYRLSNKGEIFSYSDGVYGKGFAVCLSCGRAEAQTEAGRSPVQMKDPNKEHSHNRLRGGSLGDGDKLCRGHVQNDLWLGYSTKTDVVEIQLWDQSGGLIDDEVVARSLSVALREGLARLLGIVSTELGAATQHVKDEQGRAGYSIFLFDQNSGGAGYSSQLAHNWKRVFELAAMVLDCSCDSACHHCLLGYDSQHFVDLLDHTKASPYVNNAVRQRLQLDKECRYFGAESCGEALPLSDRLRLELAKGQYSVCGIHIGGDVEHWNFAQWRLLDDLLSFSVNYKGQVVLMIPTSKFYDLDMGTRTQLAGLSNLPGERVHIMELADEDVFRGKGQLMAWLQGSHNGVGWAGDLAATTTPAEYWGQTGTGVIVTAELTASDLALEGRAVSADELLPQTESGAVRISFNHELDGKVDGFGARFWQFIGQHCPSLLAKIDNGDRIVRVEYSDRFLKSPFTVRLFSELLTELTKRGNAYEAKLQLMANSLNPSNKQPVRLFHDWCSNEERESVMRLMLDGGYLGPSWDGDIQFFAGDRFNVNHGRELELRFEDGSVSYVLFDYGMGYWSCSGQSMFSFSDTPEQQTERLANSMLKMRAPDSGLPSYLVVGFKD